MSVVLDGAPGTPVTIPGGVSINGAVTVNPPATPVATEATALGIKAGTDKLPADPAREGGNLATIAGKDFSTSALQTTGNSSLASIDGKIPANPSQEHTTSVSPNSVRLSDGTSFYKATTPSDTQPISAATLPLPINASTSALQTTGNSSLASIDGKTPSLGQALMAASSPVVLPSDQVVPTNPSDRAARLLGVVYGSQGQQIKQTATNFNSQVELAVGATLIDPRQTRALTSADIMTAVQGTAALASAPWSMRLSDGTSFYNAPTSSQLPTSLVGGRLDGNIGSWFGSTAPTVGQKTMANSVPVTIASNQPSLAVSLALGATADAFGRLRVSTPRTLFDSKQLVDNQPLVWDDAQTSGSGTTSTYNTNQASTTIAVSNATAGTRVRQTFRRFNYQSGKSMLIMMTGIIGTPATGITRRIGAFDAKNGCFFQSGTTSVSVVTRSFTSGSAVDTTIAQSSWNLDKMDGTGTSGITLDFSKTQIFVIDFEWLGVGAVRFGVNVNGILYYVHQENHANLLTLVYMSTPNLPLRYEISNSGSGGAASLLHICATVASEAGSASTGGNRRISRNATSLVTLNNTSYYPLISIQLRSGFEGADIRISALSIVCTSNAAYNWVLLLNPTVAGTALSFSAVTNSAIQADVASSNATTVTGGTAIAGETVSAVNASSGALSPSIADLQLGSSIAGVNDILVLAVQRITNTTETFFASLQYKETI